MVNVGMKIPYMDAVGMNNSMVSPVNGLYILDELPNTLSASMISMKYIVNYGKIQSNSL